MSQVNDGPKKTLLNASTIYYAFRSNFGNWGNGPIMDERGDVIGCVRKAEMPSGLRVFESDGTQILSIRNHALRAKYDLFDANGQLIGRVQNKKFLEPGLVLLVPPSKDSPLLDYKYIGEGNAYNFDIVLQTRGTAAEMRPTFMFPEVFSNIIFSFGDTYFLRVINPSLDRRLLLGYLLVIEWDYANNCTIGGDTINLLDDLKKKDA